MNIMCIIKTFCVLEHFWLHCVFWKNVVTITTQLNISPMSSGSSVECDLWMGSIKAYLLLIGLKKLISYCAVFRQQGLWQKSFVLSYTTTHCLADAYQNNEMFDKILSLLACQMITILMMSEFRPVKE